MKISNGVKTKRGSALLLATILLFVVLSLVVSLSYVTVMEQKMSQKTKSSVGAFYNSESGVEWALNKIANVDDTRLINNPLNGFTFDGQAVECPFAGSDCKVYFLGTDGKVLDPATKTIADIKAVRSVGSETQGTQRAIEAAVAGSDDKYQIACGYAATGNCVECCKLDKELGGAECKAFCAGFSNWSSVGTPPTPWTNGTPGRYSLSCDYDNNILFCCRLDAAAGNSSECKSSAGGNWSHVGPAGSNPW